MKQTIEKRKPNGIVDYFALALTTFGVGYLPLAPGTYGSAVGVVIYLAAARFVDYLHLFPPFYGSMADDLIAWFHAFFAILFLLFCFLGIWAAGRSMAFFGNSDPSQAVVDEVMGQLITFCFVPFGISWPFILAGFLLFRLFDIWKPYPIRAFESLHGGLGICADDIVAGIYAGVCLAVIYAVSLSI